MAQHRIAFIKYEGLHAGGTERWLQMMAAHLNPSLFHIDYFYSGAPSAEDMGRRRYLEEKGVRLIRFTVGKRDLNTPTQIWRDTNFWDVFKEENYDLIQTAKAGAAEYPFCLMKKPVVEYRTLAGLPDPTPNVSCSIHLSQWQRTEWFLRGGNLRQSAVIPIPAEPPASQANLRNALHIPEGAIVAGFHQRVDNAIHSPIPLTAFFNVQSNNHYFVIMGGSAHYRRQAETLKLTNIRFLDHSSDAPTISRFINTLDIFAHGRRDGETFGTVFAEAMMHGKPCLSHRTPWSNGQQETIGPAGFFAQDEMDYMQKLKLLYTLPQMREQLGKKARHHAQTYFSVQAAVKDLEAIYLAHRDGQTPLTPHMSYGISPLGFLYHGALEKENDVASHVVTQRLPEAFGFYVVKQLGRRIRLSVDAAALGGLYGFEMANTHPESHIILLETETRTAAERQETIALNRWEERFTVINSWNHFPENLRRDMDFIALHGPAFHDLMETSLIHQSNPMLLIRALSENTTLQALTGYAFWRCTEDGRLLRMDSSAPIHSPTMILALHKEKHRREIADLFRLSWAYRLERDLARLKKSLYLILKAARHPQRAMVGFRQYVRQPRDGWRF